MRLQVLLDVDDVIANFRQSYTDIASQVLNRPFELKNLSWNVEEDLGLSEEEVDLMSEFVNAPGFALNIKHFPGSLVAVERIMEFADVYFVTAPVSTSQTWVFDRTEWLRNRFGKGTRVVPTKHKEVVWGHVLVEDKVSNAQNWLRHQRMIGNQDAMACLIDWPYNRTSGAEAIPRFENLFDVVPVLQNMKR